MANNVTPFKRILDFHEQTLGKSDEEKKIIAQEQGIDFNEYERRIIGKEKEFEFFVIMKALGSFKNIEPIDEELSQISGEKTPDFAVEFTDGYKMMIEVKHTDKDEYKISMGNLQKRIDYATNYGMQLRFAISLKGFWGLFTSDFIKSKNGKLTISDYMSEKRNSWLDRELETCSYMFLRPFKFVSVYSTKATEELGVWVEPYGELISYEVYYDNHLLLNINCKDDPRYLYMFVLEAVQDRISNIFQKITTNGDVTTIVEHNENSPCQTYAEYMFVLAIIKHMRYVGKNYRDNIFLVVGEKNKHNFLPVEYIRLVMSDLFNSNIDVMCFKDGCGCSFADYQRNVWVKKSRQ